MSKGNDLEMPEKLPKALGREPLIDALFEVRFNQTSVPLADIQPGFLIGRLVPRPSISRLPAAEIPGPMRASNPALRYAPIQRLDWKQFSISLGDQNVIVNCKLPYPKWPALKEIIVDVVGHIQLLNIPGSIERYSLKYTNLISAANNSEQISKFDLSVRLGNIEIQDENMSLQVHRHKGDVIHIISVFIGAQAQIGEGPLKHGAVLDIDSIRTVNVNFTDLANSLGTGLEELRQANKVIFFSCLTVATILEMEPEYE